MKATNDISEVYQTWNTSYLLNISIIDKQHVIFFNLFDKLKILNNKDDSYDELFEVIEELEKYTNTHFKTEEALMRKANALEFEMHLEQHGIFIKKVEEFKTAYRYKNSVLLEQMINFMRKWFLMHIAEVDGKYVDSVQEYLTNKDGKSNQLEHPVL